MIPFSKGKRKSTLNVVEETLIDILGSEATRTIFNYMDNHYDLKKEEISQKMDEFQVHLKVILGKAAKIIMKKIEVRINQP